MNKGEKEERQDLWEEEVRHEKQQRKEEGDGVEKWRNRKDPKEQTRKNKRNRQRNGNTRNKKRRARTKRRQGGRRYNGNSKEK